MPHIELLDQITIDKIAAGEVIERPASVVKELVENAIDAGATAIVVEIEEGGISLMRISDNGCGMEQKEVRNAFLRHSTSKIRTAEDLTNISSLGFRGEALSSISAVSQVEMITKTKEELFGTKYRIEGGKEKGLEDIGAPNGTSFFVRQLFYNTPARRKFLKTPMTEASHIGDLLSRLALSHPEISFQFINNRQSKLHTSGNGKLKDVIYHIYGRDVANNLISLEFEKNGIKITGYLGKPSISRGNRNFENYFVNGRYIKSKIISKAIEDAYHDYTMQHKYPFVAFHVSIDQEQIDVNVHPTKMELRFSNQQEVYNLIYEALRNGLMEKPMIQEVSVPEPKEEIKHAAVVKENPVPYQVSANPVSPKLSPVSAATDQKEEKSEEEKRLDYFMKKMQERVTSYHNQNSHAEVKNKEAISEKAIQSDKVKNAVNQRISKEKTEYTPQKVEHTLQKTEQLTLFDQKIVKKDIKQEYKIIGQVFDTYWMVEFRESLYIIDQHAAHERVLYERTLKGMKKQRI